MAGAPQPAHGSAPPTGVLLTAADVARVVDRMAHQLIERATTGDGALADLVLVGIPTRGAPVQRGGPGEGGAPRPIWCASAPRPAAPRSPGGWPPASRRSPVPRSTP